MDNGVLLITRIDCPRHSHHRIIETPPPTHTIPFTHNKPASAHKPVSALIHQMASLACKAHKAVGAPPRAAPRAALSAACRLRRVPLHVCASQNEASAVSAFPNHVMVQHNQTRDKLEKKGVFSWPTWSCEVSKFPWTYDQNEDAYILEGRVVVTPEGGKPTEIKAGDFATFPAGMECTWDVVEPIKKHYRFH